MDLKEKVRQLPDTPGVYIMKDSRDDIIYIGKAKNLKNRVGQYFRKSVNHAPKILRMIENIRDFDYIFADTELEALLLECRLIKDIKPMYNSQLKNHRKYVYVYINLDEKYPTLEVVLEKKDKGLNFGPYTSLNRIERAVNVLKENLRIRYCSSFASKSSGCLNFQLGFCTAPCAGEISEIEYRQLVEEAIHFIKGTKSDLVKELKVKMLAAAESLDFDKAAKYRDDISALGHIVNKQKTIRFTENSRNMIVLEKTSQSYYKLFIIKGIRVIYKERLELMQIEAATKQYIIDLVFRYKDELMKNEGTEIDKSDIDQAQILYSYIKNKKGLNHFSIAKSWLKNQDIAKIEKGAQKFMESLME
ncbi:MAG: putative endonuclease [Clostridia bacterium]|jgi:excinuclease ABC subunit C|nr:putative endonuclease [Clostridia bacterium]